MPMLVPLRVIRIVYIGTATGDSVFATVSHRAARVRKEGALANNRVPRQVSTIIHFIAIGT